MNEDSLIYNPTPGNPATAGQVATASTIRPQRGKPADILVMPDSSPEAQKARGVKVGSLTVCPSDGFKTYEAVVINEDGKTFRGDAALWMLFNALNDEKGTKAPDAKRIK